MESQTGSLSCENSPCVCIAFKYLYKKDTGLLVTQMFAFKQQTPKAPLSAPYARWACCQSSFSGCTAHLGLCVYLQVVHDNYLLYVFAPDRESRQRWVLALKEGNYFPVPMAP